MDKKLIDGVFKSIVRINLSEAKDAIPDSVTFSRLMFSQHGVNEEILPEIIRLLSDSHKIFVFEIQRDTPGMRAEKIEGYVDADITTIRKLITTYGKVLVNYYADKYRKEALPQTIVKELMANMSSVMNTEIGIITNKFIMLNEYEKLLQKQYNEYTEEWKEAKLEELIKQQYEQVNKPAPSKTEDNNENVNTEELAAKSEIVEEVRAIDTPEYSEYEQKKNSMPVEKLLSIYGINFFIRVNFRKYDFTTIEKMVKSKIINRKSELQTVKRMIEAVKSNVAVDKNLSNHIMEIYRLERVVNQYLV